MKQATQIRILLYLEGLKPQTIDGKKTFDKMGKILEQEAKEKRKRQIVIAEREKQIARDEREEQIARDEREEQISLAKLEVEESERALKKHFGKTGIGKFHYVLCPKKRYENAKEIIKKGCFFIDGIGNTESIIIDIKECFKCKYYYKKNIDEWLYYFDINNSWKCNFGKEFKGSKDEPVHLKIRNCNGLMLYDFLVNTGIIYDIDRNVKISLTTKKVNSFRFSVIDLKPDIFKFVFITNIPSKCISCENSYRYSYDYCKYFCGKYRHKKNDSMIMRSALNSATCKELGGVFDEDGRCILSKKVYPNAITFGRVKYIVE